MSGPLVGLVNDHGPQDHNAWAVLSFIAERLHGPMRSVVLTNDEIAAGTRLSRSTVKRALALLDADAWVARQVGERRGTASTYRLRLETFPAEPVENLLARGSHRTPNDESGSTVGVHTEPLTTRQGSTVTHLGVHTEPPSVSVQTPFSGPAADEHLPGVLAGARIGPDDRYVRRALETFGLTQPSDTTRRRLGDLENAGWLARDVNAYLLANVDARNCVDLAKVVGARLKRLLAEGTPPETRQAPPPPAPEPEETPTVDVAARAAEVRRAKAAALTSRDDGPLAITEDVASLVDTLEPAPTTDRDALTAAMVARSRAASGALRRRA